MPTVPATDADVDAALADYQNSKLRELLRKIYQCRRGLGDDVVTAWEATLMAHLSAADQSGH